MNQLSNLRGSETNCLTMFPRASWASTHYNTQLPFQSLSYLSLNCLFCQFPLPFASESHLLSGSPERVVYKACLGRFYANTNQLTCIWNRCWKAHKCPRISCMLGGRSPFSKFAEALWKMNREQCLLLTKVMLILASQHFTETLLGYT